MVLDRLISLYRNNISLNKISEIASAITSSRVPTSAVAARIVNHAKWKKQVKKLEKVYQPPQRTPEWYSARNDMITASDCGQAIGEGKFGTQRDFYLKKVAPDLVPFNADLPPLVHGCKYEPVACSIYSTRNNTKVIDFGLLRHPTLSFIGASPDGITEEGIMIEIKCPWRRKIDGTVPKQYYQQIQHQLDVCSLDECDYFEVEFYEYEDQDEFLVDIHDDNDDELIASNGNEKGILIAFTQHGENKYMYGDIQTSVHQVMKWRDESCEALKLLPTVSNMCVTYWRANVIHTKRIYRDDNFLEEKYAMLKDVWDKVLEYRANLEMFRDEIIEKKKKSRKTSPSPPPVCLCDDD